MLPEPGRQGRSVPNALFRSTINLVDAKGFYAHLRYFVSIDSQNDGSTLNSAVYSALTPLTNCSLNGGMGVGLPPQVPGILGTQADFGSVEDKAVMVFIDAVGQIHRYQVPAPVSSIFLADGMTVDSANVNVLAFADVMINSGAHAYFVSSRGQNSLNTFVGGIRIRRRNQRRINIFTRNPEETGPAE